MNPAPSRADDERLLALLAARQAGVTTPALARTTGLTATYIRNATNRVRNADLAESGEPVGDVLRHYGVRT